MRKNDGSGTRDVDGQCRRKVCETRLAWRREEKERQATGVKKKTKKTTRTTTNPSHFS